MESSSHSTSKSYSNETIDVIYKYISKNGKQNEENFIIPDIPRTTLTLKNLYSFLQNDDVDISKIIEIKYLNELTQEYIPIKSLEFKTISNQSTLQLLICVTNTSIQNYLIELQNRLEVIDKKIKEIKKTQYSELSIKKTSSFCSPFLFEFPDKEIEPIDGVNQSELIYLYANPLLKDLAESEFIKDNNCHSQIKTIYDVLSQKNLNFRIEFNPILDFNEFIATCRKAPKILHICCNAIEEKVNGVKKMFLCFEKQGCLDKIREDEIQTSLSQEPAVKSIELAIISTPNAKKLGHCFISSGIQNVICINNEITFPHVNIIENNFIENLYQNLFRCNSIMSSYLSAKNSINSYKNELCSILGDGDNVLFNSISSTLHSKGRVILNQNCILNCCLDKDCIDFRMIGRNEEMHCVYSRLSSFSDRIVFVTGDEGVGKKMFVKQMGKYLYERRIFSYIKYFECGLSEEEIKMKINEIKQTTPPLDQHNSLLSSPDIHADSNKTLIIIAFDLIFENENEYKLIENILFKLKCKYIDYSFLVAITTKGNFSMSQFSPFTLKPLSFKTSELLFKMLITSLHGFKIHKTNKQLENIIKSANGYINEIYLRVGYLCSLKNKNIIKIEAQTPEIVEEIMNNINKEDKNRLILFSILKNGISKDELSLFGNTENVKNNFFLIFQYVLENSKEVLYQIDNSFIHQIIAQTTQNEEEIILYSILRVYSGILRNILLHKKYNFSQIYNLNAKINNGVWLSLNEELFWRYYKNSFEKHQFEFRSYHEVNLNNIFSEKYINKIKQLFQNKKNKQETYAFLKEYIEQISICYLTLLNEYNHKKNSLNEKLKLFISLCEELDLKDNKCRLVLFQCSITGNTKYLDNLDKSKLRKELIGQIYLMRIIEHIKKKVNDIEIIYEQCYKIFAELNDQFNLSRLYFLYGLCNKDNEKCLKYFDKVIEQSKQDLNLYIVIQALLAKANFYLEKDNFALAQKNVTKSKKIVLDNQNEIGECMEEIEKTLTKIKDEYKNSSQHVLHFLIAEQLLDYNNHPIRGVINNSYYFYYEIKKKIKSQFKINFKIFKPKIVEDLFQFPGTFLYISSDDFDSQGNIYFEDDKCKSQKISISDLKTLITSNQTIYDLVILDFINSEYFCDFLISHGFPHVISLSSKHFLIKEFINKNNFIQLNNIRKYMKIFVLNLLENLVEGKPLKECFNIALFIFKNDLKQSNSNDTMCSLLDSIKDSCENNENDIIILKPFESDHQEIIFKECSSYGTENDDKLVNDKIRAPTFHHSSKSFPCVNESERLFGRKTELDEIINYVKNKQYFNIYGKAKVGKSLIGIEICKYFFIRNYFKDGIHYIDTAAERNIKKLNEIKTIHQKDEANKLIVLDHFDKHAKKKFFFANFPLKSGIHYVFITKEMIPGRSNLYDYFIKNILNRNEARELFVYLLNMNGIFEITVEYEKQFARCGNEIGNIFRLSRKILQLIQGKNIDLKTIRFKTCDKDIDNEEYKETKISKNYNDYSLNSNSDLSDDE